MKLADLNEHAVEIILENNHQRAQKARNIKDIAERLRLYRSIGTSLIELGESLRTLDKEQ